MTLIWSKKKIPLPQKKTIQRPLGSSSSALTNIIISFIKALPTKKVRRKLPKEWLEVNYFCGLALCSFNKRKRRMFVFRRSSTGLSLRKGGSQNKDVHSVSSVDFLGCSLSLHPTYWPSGCSLLDAALMC